MTSIMSSLSSRRLVSTSARLATKLIKHQPLLRFNARALASVAASPIFESSITSGSGNNFSNNSDKKPFDRILIANRGDIASRVIRTCNRLGIETVAVHSSADSQADFVKQATHSYNLGGTSAAESYLDMDKLEHAVQVTGSQAVHPGFGFLSENAVFAQRVASMKGSSGSDDTVKWIGPPAKVIHDMGDKVMAKEWANKAGVNCVPGSTEFLESVPHALGLIEATPKLEFPIMLKAAAGGGGKGMRICWTAQELRESFALAQAEALQFFKDDRLLMEQYMPTPHHIEFQVICGIPPGGSPSSQTTDVCIFPERECSIQRRHQKIIEETPSVVGLTEETRQSMARQVQSLCEAVQYESAGTVEFLVVDKGNGDQDFFFLEVNTRLQVEHAVTEELCGGVDLVEAMLHVAAGWGLPESLTSQRTPGQLIFPFQGHAIESRIYAEDPVRGFVPSTGPLVRYQEPTNPDPTSNDETSGSSSKTRLRMDTGVSEGTIVSPYYDPMLSKVIVYGETRQKAIDGMANALDQYVIEGIRHNVPFLRDVLRQPDYGKGDTPTSFIPEHYHGVDGKYLFTGVQLSPTEKSELAGAIAQLVTVREGIEGDVVVCLGGMFGQAYRVSKKKSDEAKVVTYSVNPIKDDTSPSEVTIDQMDYHPTQILANVSINGIPRTIQCLGNYENNRSGALRFKMFGADVEALVLTPREYELSQHMKEPVGLDTANMVLSPMPGTLLRYMVFEGEEVEENQELCVVEAMKMQNSIRAPRAGVIGKLKAEEGSSLMADDVLIEFVKE